jgi:hypothetical protein
MLNWIKWALFISQMIIRYGPKLWKLGKEIYNEIERRVDSKNEKLSSDAKAKAFNKLAVSPYMKHKKKVPMHPDLNRFRENIWTAKNRGKTRKALKDPKLFAKGKTRG